MTLPPLCALRALRGSLDGFLRWLDNALGLCGHTCAVVSVPSEAGLAFAGEVVSRAGAVRHAVAREGERREADVCKVTRPVF